MGMHFYCIICDKLSLESFQFCVIFLAHSQVAINGEERRHGRIERIGPISVKMTRAHDIWQMEDAEREFTLTFYRRERIFRLRVGGRWHGRVQGLLGTPGNFVVDEGEDVLKPWRTSLGDGSKWSIGSSSKCLVSATSFLLSVTR